MIYWYTTIEAKDPQTGELCKWVGPKIPALTRKEAEQYCQENELGYCKIEGILIATAITKENGEVDEDSIEYYMNPN